MKFSSFRAACDSLAKFLLGGHAFASVFLRNDPVLSPQNPALVFRIEFGNLGDSGEKLRDTIIAPLKSAAPQMDDGMLAMRAITRGMNMHRPFVDLNLGMCHVVSGTLSTEGMSLAVEFRCSPVSYEHDS